MAGFRSSLYDRFRSSRAVEALLGRGELRALLGRSFRDALNIKRPQRPSLIFVNHEERFLYVSIPKTGSTSIRTALRQAGLLGQRETVWLCELLRRRPELKNYLKFAVVRNPWARALSVYHDKICRDSRFRLSAFHGLRRTMSFDAFVEWLAFHPDGSDRFGDVHWISQHHFVFDRAELALDFLIKQERLGEGFRALTETMNWAWIPLKRRNKTQSIDGPNAYRSAYTQRTRHLIGERYAQDIAAFGYDF